MGNRRDYLISELVKFCGKLDQKGFVANHDGNLSVQFEESLLATPTAEAKGLISKDMIITLDQSGKKIAGVGNPFSEISLHIACYRARPDAKAVVHAHPPWVTALGLVGKSVDIELPEGIVSLGDSVPCVEFAMPGDKSNDDIIYRALQETDTFLMPGNGIISIGDTLEQAYLRIELAEHIAHMNQLASQMGQIHRLTAEQRKSLLEKRKKGGLGPQARLGTSPSVVSHAKKEDPLRTLIESEIQNFLKGK